MKYIQLNVTLITLNLHFYKDWLKLWFLLLRGRKENDPLKLFKRKHSNTDIYIEYCPKFEKH